MRINNSFLSASQNFLAVILLTGIFYQSAWARTSIDPPQVTEGKQSNNNVVITHGCGGGAVIGQSVVVPDGATSTIAANGNPYNGPLTDFLQNWVT